MNSLLRRAAALAPSWPADAPAEKVEAGTRFFYAALLWMSATLIFETRNSFRTILVDAQRLHWPAFWVRWTGAERAFLAVSVLLVAASFLAALRPGRRWVRALACLALWEYVAVMVSIGELFPICHQWVGVAFILAFLPDRFAAPDAPRAARENAAVLFWAAQAFFLMTYSMAGLSKLLTAAWQSAHGEPSIFTAKGCASMAADYILEKGRLGPLEGWLKSSGSLPALMFAGALAELGVFGLAWKPRLHAAAGAAVVAFHLATFLTLGIFFKTSVLLAAVLLFASPFRPREGDAPAAP